MQKVLLTIGFCLWCVTQAGAQTKPNILIMLSDDQGIGSATENVSTPNIDSIGKAGVKYTVAYGMPACITSRNALLAGQYPQRRSMGNSQGNGPFLPAAKVTFVRLLKDAGYSTNWVGKWHEGFSAGLYPLDRGADTFFGYKGAPNPHYLGRDEMSPLFDQRVKKFNPAGVLLGDTLADRAVAILNMPRKVPLLLVIGWNGIHDPMEGATVQTRLAQLDKQIGKVLAAVKPNTIVIFMGDNGLRSSPFRGTKMQILEGGVRVPAVFSWSGHIPTGQVIHTPVSIIDIAPTVLDAADVPAGITDGQSWFNLDPNRFIYLDAYDADPGKKVSGPEPGKGIRQGSLVYYNNYLGIEHQLYKPNVDKGLSNNLQGSLTAERDRMLALLNSMAAVLAD